MPADPPAPSDASLPVRIGGYRVLRRLATGGTSDVLLARAEGPHGFERAVVLKLLLQQYRDNQQFERMFAREATAYARLSHPAIVKLYDFFSDAGQPVMVLEYVEGLPLHKMRALSRMSRFLDDQAAFFVGARIFGALAAAHAAVDPQTGEIAPVIHRDVNPSNVLIPWDGHVKLADFGIAKITGVDHDKTQAGFIKGTYGYMAPEQVRGEDVTVRSDVYVASLLVWELLVGRKAIVRGNGSDLEVLRAMSEPAFPTLDALRPELPRAVLDAIARGLEKDPQRRDIGAKEIAAAIRGACDLEQARQRLVDTLAAIRPASHHDIPSGQVAKAKEVLLAPPPPPPPPPDSSPDATIPNPLAFAAAMVAQPRRDAHDTISEVVQRAPLPARPFTPKVPSTPAPPPATTQPAPPPATTQPAPPPAPTQPAPPPATTQPPPARPPPSSRPPVVQSVVVVASPPPPPPPATTPLPPPPPSQPLPPLRPLVATLPMMTPQAPFPPTPPGPAPVAWTPPPAPVQPTFVRSAPPTPPWGRLVALVVLVGVVLGVAAGLLLWARDRSPTAYTPPARPSATSTGTTSPVASATASAPQPTPAESSPPTVVVASAAPSAPASEPAPASTSPDLVGTTGTITVPESRASHRVWVEKHLVGEAPATFTVKCGWHIVKVGSHGNEQNVNVPCGGDIEVK